MKTITTSGLVKSLFVSVLFALFLSVGAQTPEAKKEAEMKKLETNLATAKAALAKVEKQKAKNDSLVEVANKMIDEGEAEMKTLEAEVKKADKEYATQVKSLDKQSASKDKETATQAKADLKKLDLQFKADMKVTDTKVKAAMKKMTTGEGMLVKCGTAEKTINEAMKKAMSGVEAVEEKIAAINAEAASAEKEKEKKEKKAKK